MSTDLTSLEQTLAQLIAQPTISTDTSLNTEVLTGIEKDLQDLGMDTKLVIHNDSPSLIASFTGFDETPLWLAAHIDVVPGSPQDFQLKVKAQKLYGRGAYDMKYAIAGYLELARDLASPMFGIIITSDEELGGQDGSAVVAKEINFANSTVILPDGGGPWKIERKAKGGLWLTLAATGISAHASRPYLGVNAITKIVAAIHDLEIRLPHQDGTNFEDLTFVIGTIQGGMAMNQLAESATASIDIRFGSRHTLPEVKKMVNDILADHPDITSSPVMETEQHDNDLEHADTKLLQACTQEVLGREFEIIDSNGGTDAPFFAAAGAHTIVFHPDGGGQHSEDEHITREGLQQFYDILKAFVEQRLAE